VRLSGIIQRSGHSRRLIALGLDKIYGPWMIPATTCSPVRECGITPAQPSNITISPLGRSAYSTAAPVSPRGLVDGSGRPAPRWRDDLDLIGTHPPAGVGR
jgi:hypothetical protein